MDAMPIPFSPELFECWSAAPLAFQRCALCSQPLDVLEPPGWRMEPPSKKGPWVMHPHGEAPGRPDHCLPCSLKAAQEKDRERLVEQHHDFLEIKERLDLPSWITMHVISGPDLLKQRAGSRFTVTAYGARVSELNAGHGSVPTYVFRAETGVQSFEFVLPLLRISYPGISAYLEARWFSYDPWSSLPSLEIVGWQSAPPGDLRQLMEGKSAIDRFAARARGRPLGTGWYQNAAEFHDARNAAIENLRSRGVKTPKEADILMELSMTRSTYNRYKHLFPPES